MLRSSDNQVMAYVCNHYLFCYLLLPLMTFLLLHPAVLPSSAVSATVK